MPKLYKRTKTSVSRASLGVLAGVLALTVVGCGEEPAVNNDADAAADATKDTGQSKGDTENTNNWVQGYSVTFEFHGSYADGKKFTIDRDLYDVAASKQVFSFGSTHYSFGEIGFAMTESLAPVIGGKKLPMEFQLNFGLVKGSSKNPVHVDKVGTYPFGCRAPEVRISFMAEDYRTTCDDANGSFEITDWSDSTGGEFRGSFKGRVSAYNDQPNKPNPCDAASNKLVCKQPKVWADVSGNFGFTLPSKDG